MVDVFVSGNYAYLAVSGLGIQILDISDPTNPQEKGSWLSARVVETSSIYFANNKIYLGVSSPSALLIFDGSNPNSIGAPLIEIGQHSTLYDIKVIGDYIFIADHSGSFMIANHTQNLYNKDDYWVANNYWCLGVVVDGNYAYTATSSKGLVVWDITDKSHPSIVAEKPISGANSYTIALYGSNKIVVGGYAGWFGIFDISTKTNPILLGNIDITSDPGKGRGVEVSGDYAIVADYTDGIVTLGLSSGTPTQNTILPNEAGSTSADRGYAIAIDGDLIYGAMGFSGLKIWNLTQAIIGGGGGLQIPGYTLISTIFIILGTIALVNSKKFRK